MNKTIQEDIQNHLAAMKQYLEEAQKYTTMLSGRLAILEDFMKDTKRYEQLVNTFIELNKETCNE